MQPAAASECLQREVAHLTVGNGSGREVDIIVEIGDVPHEVGRVGQHTEAVFMEPRLPAHNLKHHLPSALFCNSPVDGRAARVYRHHMNAAHGFLHLVDGLEVGQHPRNELQVADGGLLVRLIILFIFSVVGKIEQPSGQTGFVHAFDDKLGLLDGQPHISVACRKAHALLLSVGQQRTVQMTARHYGIFALKVVAGPFYRAGRHRAACSGVERDAGTGQSVLWKSSQQENGCNKHQVFHNCLLF